MAIVKTVQATMAGGELSPKVFGRVDIDQYFAGCAKARNVYITTQGGMFRREGMERIANTQSDLVGKLIDFAFNDVQTYLLVLTIGRLDIYRDDGTGSVTLQATITSSPISTLTDAIINEIRWTQSADTLFLFHKDLPPIKITRTSHTVWTAVNVTFDFIPLHAFGAVSQAAKTSSLSFTAQANADEYKLTAASTNFLASHVGQQVIANFGIFQIISFIDTSNVIAKVLSEPSSFTATTNWIIETGYEDVWSVTRGYPSTGAFFQGRLYLAGGSRPQTIWASVVGDFLNFELGKGNDADGLDFTIDDDRVNAIVDLFPGRSMQIFTTGGEFFIRGGSLDSPITPSNIQILKGTLHGSDGVKPISVDGSTLFIEKGGSVLREFVFTDAEQSFEANDISRLAPHLILNPTRMTVRSATNELPSPYVYLVNDDGTMTVVAISRKESLLAFSLFETNGTIEDVCAVDRDVFLIVKRTINSVDVRFIERLNSNHFLDGSERVDNVTPTTSWTGFDHLDDEEVEVRADDFVFPNVTPSSGAFTTESATILEAGLGFACLYQSMPIDADIQGRLLTGDWKRLVSVNMRVYESRNLIVQRTTPNGTSTYRPSFRQFGASVLDAPVSNFTGWKRVFLSGIDRDSQVTITQDEPLEFNLLSVTLELGN